LSAFDEYVGINKALSVDERKKILIEELSISVEFAVDDAEIKMFESLEDIANKCTTM
jgi:hypothetical protein